jgi:hypothetical protein
MDMQPWVSISLSLPPPPFFCFSVSCCLSLGLGPRQLAEALLSLANLTADEGAREALYARAQAEGGEAVARELAFKPSRSRSRTLDVRMDES